MKNNPVLIKRYNAEHGAFELSLVDGDVYNEAYQELQRLENKKPTLTPEERCKYLNLKAFCEGLQGNAVKCLQKIMESMPK